MTSAIFPHNADHYKVLYGIDRLEQDIWLPVHIGQETVGPVLAQGVLTERDDRDKVLNALQQKDPKTIFRKTTIHVVCNVIPERDPSEAGTPNA